MTIAPDALIASTDAGRVTRIWHCLVQPTFAVSRSHSHASRGWQFNSLSPETATTAPQNPPKCDIRAHSQSAAIAISSSWRSLEHVAAQARQAGRTWWERCSGTLLAPLQLRDFRLLFCGQFISSVGDQFYLVALPWLLLDRGGSTGDLGLVLSAYGVPRVAALLAGGRFSDWLRPRRVMLLADIARALVLLTLTVLAMLGNPPLWLLCVVVAPLGFFTGLFLPASYTIAPDLVPAEHLQAANGMTTSSLQLARLVGPGLGGIAVGQFRAGAVLAVDALSFIASVVTLAAIHPGPRETHSSRTPVGESAADAPTATPATSLWQLIRQSSLLRTILILVGLGNVTSGAVIDVALPAYAHGPLTAGASGYGLILGAWGAGALIGGIAASGLGHVPRRGRLMLLVTLGEAAGIALVPIAGQFFGIAGVVADLALFGVANGLSNVLLIALVQQSFPRHLLGRIMGAFLLAAYGIYPLSVAIGGLVAQWFGTTTMFPLAGLALFAAVLYAWSQGTIRTA